VGHESLFFGNINSDIPISPFRENSHFYPITSTIFFKIIICCPASIIIAYTFSENVMWSLIVYFFLNMTYMQSHCTLWKFRTYSSYLFRHFPQPHGKKNTANATHENLETRISRFEIFIGRICCGLFAVGRWGTTDLFFWVMYIYFFFSHHPLWEGAYWPFFFQYGTSLFWFAIAGVRMFEPYRLYDYTFIL